MEWKPSMEVSVSGKSTHETDLRAEVGAIFTELKEWTTDKLGCSDFGIWQTLIFRGKKKKAQQL